MDIAIDFDGTVVTHDYPKIGRSIGAENILRKLIDSGHNLILNTMRSGKQLDDAIDWFKEKNIPLYGIQYNPTQQNWSKSNKCYAHLYIDDAALGCPLIYPKLNGDELEINGQIYLNHNRPYVSWKLVEKYLIENGII